MPIFTKPAHGSGVCVHPGTRANRQEAEDLTSEVFHKALANLANYEWRGTPFAAWLFRIASNAVADRWKQASRESGDPVPDAGDDSSMEEIERRAMLYRMVNTLPADQRRVVLLRFTEQQSIREIAEAIGRTEGAVKQLQFRALQTLRKGKGDTHG